jgi:hypothetical protein
MVFSFIHPGLNGIFPSQRISTWIEMLIVRINSGQRRLRWPLNIIEGLRFLSPGVGTDSMFFTINGSW